MVVNLRVAICATLGLCLAASGVIVAGEWHSWRGPHQNGVSDETGLVSDWSPDGENLIWKADFIGRSTPVVYDGQACVMGRTNDSKATRQEIVACFDAGSGAKKWEHRYNIYNTTVPFQRVGWASPVADPDTGNLYTMGSGGQLNCYSRDGELLWSYFLTEEFGRASGYGGRTNTPLIDGDLLLLSVINIGWGKQAAPRNRYFAFDKRTGEVVWVSTPSRAPADMNTQSVPVTATIGGQRLLINGAADGWIYALKVGTGEKVWEFHLSQRGVNSNVVVEGSTVFVGHSEENIDAPVMGRVVAFDASGTGDITKTAEKWRRDELAVGFPSPAYKDGILYVIDNSANLYALDAASGETKWTFNVGTVGKGSPVLADGKIYVAEVNGRFQILENAADGAKPLDLVELEVEGGVYCLGDKSEPFEVADGGASAGPGPGKGEGPVKWLQVVPAEIRTQPGGKLSFTARAFDAKGRLIGEVPAEWSLEGLVGKVDSTGNLVTDKDTPFQGGQVVATVDGMSAQARVRVISDLPWAFDFEGWTGDRAPGFWIAAGRPWQVREVEGNQVLVKIRRDSGLLRNALYMGPSTMSNYSIQADVWGNKKGRRITDVGLIANGYTLDLQGNLQKLEVRSWPSERRMAQAVDFAWEQGIWYTMKMKVEVDEKKALILGKVWKRDEDEPADWSIRVEDATPIPTGSPGLVGYSPADIYYDNIKVTVD
jgi:outer membrane protein assembly factor BamB